MQPPPPRGPGAGALLLAFVAGALGGAAAALIVGPRASQAATSEDAALKDAIAGLERTVRELGQRVAGSSRPPPAAGTQPVEPLAPAGSDDVLGNAVAAQLLTRLDHIAKLLETRAGGGASSFTGAAPLPPLDLSRAATDRSPIVAMSGEENEQRRLWRQHAFWTCQQVLEAYGLPDRVEAADGAMTWEYETTERTVTFQFYEGMLINIWS